MKEMNKLFTELWWLTNDEESMYKFVKAIKKYISNLGGDVCIGLIDLYNFGFQRGHLYIAYDDCTGCTGPQIFQASKFVEYYKEILNEHKEFQPEQYWNKELKKIIQEE